MVMKRVIVHLPSDILIHIISKSFTLVRQQLLEDRFRFYFYKLNGEYIIWPVDLFGNSGLCGRNHIGLFVNLMCTNSDPYRETPGAYWLTDELLFTSRLPKFNGMKGKVVAGLYVFNDDCFAGASRDSYVLYGNSPAAANHQIPIKLYPRFLFSWHTCEIFCQSCLSTW